jgi:hypothetical protein
LKSVRPSIANSNFGEPFTANLGMPSALISPMDFNGNNFSHVYVNGHEMYIFPKSYQ